MRKNVEAFRRDWNYCSLDAKGTAGTYCNGIFEIWCDGNSWKLESTVNGNILYSAKNLETIINYLYN